MSYPFVDVLYYSYKKRKKGNRDGRGKFRERIKGKNVHIAKKLRNIVKIMRHEIIILA